MKTVSEAFVQLGMLCHEFQVSKTPDARTAARDRIVFAIEQDRADACREPREVLRECRTALAHCIFSPERTERLWSRMNALLADAPAPERPEPAADSMHLGGADYARARARSFEGLQADCAARRDRFSFYLGHDEGFNLGLSVASVNKLVAAHEPHLEALRDATAAVRDRANEPTAEQVAEAARERCATRFVQSRQTAEYGISGNVVRSIYEFILATPLAPILKKLGVEPSAAGGRPSVTRLKPTARKWGV